MYDDQKIESAVKFLSDNMPIDGLSKPTLLHSLRVGLKLNSSGCDSDICIAGLLHDLIEDSGVSYDDIKKEFGSKVATWVEANTKNKSIKDKEERVKDLLARCVVYEEAAIVKAADILDNIEYYKRINNTESLETMLVRGTLLLSMLPKEFKSKVFKELSRALSV